MTSGEEAEPSSSSGKEAVTEVGAVKEPSEGLFVQLAEALTWIAFKHAYTTEELKVAVEGETSQPALKTSDRIAQWMASNESSSQHPENGLRHFADRNIGLAQLDKAWLDLRNAVGSSKLEIRGRYSHTYLAEIAWLQKHSKITEYTLANYSQFDVSTGGLRRRPKDHPFILWQGHELAYEREWQSFGDDLGARDGYVDVEVSRAELLELFRAKTKTLSALALQSTIGDLPTDKNSAGRAPSVKTGRPPSDAKILAKADEMHARSLGGYKIASSMRLEAGFENVQTNHVRELIKGRYKSGGRPLKKSE